MITAIIPYTTREGLSLGVLGNNNYHGIDDLITSFAFAIDNNKGTRFYKKTKLMGFYLQSKKDQSIYAIRKDQLATIINDEFISSVVFIKPDDYFTGKMLTSINLLIKDYETINEIKLTNKEKNNIKKITRLHSKKILDHYLTQNGFSDEFTKNITEIIDLYKKINFQKKIQAPEITRLISEDLNKTIIINRFFNKLAEKINLIDYNFFEEIIKEINKISDFGMIKEYINSFNNILD